MRRRPPPDGKKRRAARQARPTRCGVAFRENTMAMTRRDFLKGGIMTAGVCTGSSLLPGRAASGREISPFPAHAPCGTGVGVFPGRVVWTRDPSAVRWDGQGYWWQPEHFSESAVLAMVRSGIAALAGTSDAVAGWQTLFRHHNESRGRSGGCAPGQRLAVKANMNGAGAYSDDPHGRTHESYTSPVLLRALLLSLIEDAGVAPQDITVYDAGRVIPEYMRRMCSSGPLTGVLFRHRDPNGPLDALPDRHCPVRWSRDIAGAVNYLPACVTEATYLINLASLKGHCYGMTLCGKNHFGSILNADRMRAPQAAGLHALVSSSRMGDYAVLADLTANRHLGGKTMLCMLDGLITAPGESVNITREKALWRQPPFNGNFCSSLFFSQDPVAIDSVGADFLVNEPVMREHNALLRHYRGMENYLHEAALIASPPSGTIYRDGFGGVVSNLGVHEHWNNPEEKLYSRNLGGKEGIELVRA